MSDSSPTEQDTVPAPEVSDASTTPAAPSTADQGVGSMLDAVKAATAPEPKEASPASTTTETTTDPASTKVEEERLPDDPSEDELRDQKPQTRKRIQQLLSDRESLRGRVAELEPRVREFDTMLEFVRQNDLSKEDLDAGFEIMSLLKREDYEGALQKLQPVLAQVYRAVGAVLPADLQEQVNLGYITEQHARDLVRSRVQAATASSRLQRTEQQAQEERQAAEVKALVQKAAGAATTWETQKRQSDPDWHLKADRIHELTRLEVYEKGYPQSEKHVVELLNGIYDRVTKEMRRFSPAPTAVKPATGTAAARTAPEPKSMLDVVKMAAGR